MPKRLHPGRSIHNNFRAIHLTCKALHQKKRSCLLLKIDIAKAFDSVCWPFLLEVLRQLWFSQRWRNWISILLGSATTRILLNGRPGDRICHAWGLQHGDPLSPMLSVIAMEVLSGLIRWAHDQSLFSPLRCVAVRSRVSLYADDVVMFIVPKSGDLAAIKTILRVFGDASGLYTNLDKCVATPIACSLQELEQVTDMLSCAMGASHAGTWASHYPPASSTAAKNSSSSTLSPRAFRYGKETY